MELLSYTGGLGYLWMIVFVMISAGLAKEHQLFAPVFAYVRNVFRSNRFVLVILSAIGGVLPISGRVTVSAGLIDTIAPKEGKGREKMGIVDYLATHHYYLWSPLEKTVILPIAAFGLTYGAWLEMIWPMLAVSLLFIGWYVWYQVHEDDVVITPSKFKMSAVTRNVFPMVVSIATYVAFNNYYLSFGLLALYYMMITATWDYKKLLGYINWEVILVVGAVIILGNYFKANEAEFKALITDSAFDPTTLVGMGAITAIGFAASFLMGSSGKFIAFAVLLAQLFGMEYFLWFFAVDYAGYLLSPTHKCVMVGNRYFGTPYSTYYKALGTWGALLLATGGILTFVV
jgi:hypothetical protein